MSNPFACAARTGTCVLVSIAALLAFANAPAHAASKGGGVPLDAVPNISIADVTITEGNSGAKYAAFTVSLSEPAAVDVSFDVATAEIGAIGNDDFQHAYGNGWTIPAGQTSIQLNRVIFGDTVVEADEKFEVILENVSNATLVDGIAIGTILNDDSEASPTLVIADAWITEGNAGTKNAFFQVQLSKPAATAVTFNVATANGTASAGSDYTAIDLANQSIAAGELYKTVAVVISGDGTLERDETFSVNLSNASGAGIGRSRAIGTIGNDDNVPAVKISVSDAYVNERNSGPQTATFYVQLTQAAASTVTFDIKTEDSSANAGSDYVANSLTGQTIPAGQTSKTFTVTVNGDTTPESEERFIVTLGNISTNAALQYADPHGVATIPNDDTVISLGDAAIAEGQGGSKMFAFPVTLSAPIADGVSFQVVTCGGTATPYTDYYPKSAGPYLTYMNPGVTSMNVYVEVLGDTEQEPDETFCVDLTEVSGAALGDVHAEATILNDDLPPPTVTIGPGSALEGDSSVQSLSFPLTLSHAPQATVVVNFHTESCGGTAEPDITSPLYQTRDYIPSISGSIWITNGVNLELTVGIRGDTDIEPDEQFCMVIDVGSGGVLGNSSATGTIINDDFAPALSIGDASIAEGDAGTKSAIFTVSLSKPATSTVIFDIATDNGTAAAGVDYVSSSAVGQSILAGQTTTSFTVAINGDQEVEDNETFTVNLDNVTGVAVTDRQGRGTIVNDDKATLSIANVSITEGDSGISTATFVLNLSRPMPTGVSFDISTANGTAVAGSDYTALTQVGRVFDAGRTRALFEVQINGDAVAEENESFSALVTNVQGAALVNGSATATIQNDDAALTPISQIQGAGPTSPLSGALVETEGVVTALVRDGFFLQSIGSDRDSDPSTSEGLFVASNDASARKGDYVRVLGRVQESLAGDEPDQLTMTTIVAMRLTQLDEARPLPARVVVDGDTFRSLDSISGLERYEGMRLSVPNLRVTSPVEGKLDAYGERMLSTGVFYAVAAGLPRPFREPGIDLLDIARRRPGVNPPVSDSNPERLRIDSLGQRGASGLAADVGDTLSGLTGVLGYSHGAYELLPDESSIITSTTTARARAVQQPSDAQATIGVLSLQDPRADGLGSDKVMRTSNWYATQLAKTANAICRYARNPDIVAINGAADGAVLSDLVGAANDRDGNILFAGECSSQARYRMNTGDDASGVGLMVNSDPVRHGVPRVEVLSAVSLGKAEQFPHRDGTVEPLHASLPMLSQARINSVDGRSLEVTLLLATLPRLEGKMAEPGPHGWRRVADYLRALRAARATSIAAMVQARQQSHPAERLIVLGNFETSEFNDGHADLMGVITGREAARDRVLTYLDSPVNPSLTNLTLQLDPTERYTVSRDGNAVAVDHVLVSNTLMRPRFGAHLEVARINSDFGEDNRDDAGVPMRVSSHDPVVLYLTMPRTP